MSTQTVHAYKKLTNRYNAAWAHLDEEESLDFSMEVFYGKTRYDSDGERKKVVAHVTVSRPITREELVQSLHYFTTQCRCEHDCCGHWNGGASSPRQVTKDGIRWAIPLHYAMNV